MTGPRHRRRRRSEWQRLDPRMLLVHPVRELVRFLPVLSACSSPAARPATPLALSASLLPSRRGRCAASHPLPDRRRPGRAAPRPAQPHGASRPRSTGCARSTSRPRSIHRIARASPRCGSARPASAADGDALDLDGLPVERARALRAELLRAATAEPRRRGPDGRAGPTPKKAATHRGHLRPRRGCGSPRSPVPGSPSPTTAVFLQVPRSSSTPSTRGKIPTDAAGGARLGHHRRALPWSRVPARRSPRHRRCSATSSPTAASVLLTPRQGHVARRVAGS